MWIILIAVLFVSCTEPIEDNNFVVGSVRYDYGSALEKGPPYSRIFSGHGIFFSTLKGVSIGVPELSSNQRASTGPNLAAVISDHTNEALSADINDLQDDTMVVGSKSKDHFEWHSSQVLFADGTICSKKAESRWICRDIPSLVYADNLQRILRLSSQDVTVYAQQFGFLEFPQFDGASYVADYCGLFGSRGSVTCYYLGAMSDLTSPISETFDRARIVQIAPKCCFEADWLIKRPALTVTYGNLLGNIFMLADNGKVYFAGYGGDKVYSAGSGGDLTVIGGPNLELAPSYLTSPVSDLWGLQGPTRNSAFVPVTQAVELTAINGAVGIVNTGMALCWQDVELDVHCYKYSGLEAGGPVITPPKLRGATKFYVGSGVLCADTSNGLVCGVWMYSDASNDERKEHMHSIATVRNQYCVEDGRYCNACEYHGCSDDDIPIDWQWDR